METFSLLSLTLLLLGFFGGELSAQHDDERRAHIRDRWEAMSDDDRSTFKQRMDELRAMGDEERQALKAQAAQLEERKGKQLDKLGKKVKRQLSEMNPEQRDRLLREYFDECERERGVRLREQLPLEFLERLEGVRPHERPMLMREFREEMRGRASERMLFHMRHEMNAPPEVLEMVARLPMPERRQAMLEFKREDIRKRVELDGPPPGISEEEWKQLDLLPLEEFFMQFGLRRFEGKRSDPRGPRGVEPGRRPGRLGPGGRFGRFGRDPNGVRPRGGRPVSDDQVSEGDLQSNRELMRLIHPEIEDLVESWQLEPQERQESISSKMRERSLEFLEQHPIFEASEMERLRGLSSFEFVHELRSYLGRSRGRRWAPPERGFRDRFRESRRRQ